jgi:hypothetical protein
MSRNGMELGSVTLKGIGFFCFPIKHPTPDGRKSMRRFSTLRHSSKMHSKITTSEWRIDGVDRDCDSRLVILFCLG